MILSRLLKSNEYLEAKNKGLTLKEIPVAIDGFDDYLKKILTKMYKTKSTGSSSSLILFLGKISRNFGIDSGFFDGIDGLKSS